MKSFNNYVNETVEMLSEKSINKINKEFTATVNKMAEKAEEYKAAEGDAKTAILAELKELNAKKSDLMKELDKAVAGKDRNVELAITEKTYNKNSLMKAMKADDGMIQLGNGQEYVIYAYDNGNDDNDDMWGDKTIFALDQDGEEHEINYSDIVSYSESVVNEASGDLKIGDHGIDYNDNVVEIIAIGRFAKIAKMFKKETKADVEDHGIEELMVNTDYYLTKNIESPEGNVGDYYIYPVRYDMANYWGLDPLKESVVTEAKRAGLSKKETLKVAQKFAAALTKLDGMKYTVSSDYEEDSFDLDIEDQDDVDPRITGEYAGGSYNINDDGSVVNMATWNRKTNVSPTYGNMDDDIKTIIKTIKNLKESVANEKADISGAYNDLEHLLGTDPETMDDFQRIENDGTWEEMADFIEMAGDDEVLQVHKFRSQKDIFKLAKYIMGESVVTEAKLSKVYKAAKQGSYPVTLVVIEKGKVIKQELVGTPEIVPAAFNILQEEYPKAIIHIEDRTGKRLFTESVVTEGRVTLKRRYTENHPAVTVSKNAKVRNKVLEFIKDGRITQVAFEKFVADLSNNSKRWTKNNSKYFTISEEGVSLSKMGKKLLAGITVNEGKVSEDEIDTVYIEGTFKDGGEFYEDQETTDIEWVKKNYRKITKDLKSSEIFVRMNNGDEITYSEYKKQVNEKTEKNPGVWVPGEFDKEIGKYPTKKITRDIVLKAAKKYKIDLEDAIKYVEYGWAIDLNENKTTKTQFIYESFSEFVNSLNESNEILNEGVLTHDGQTFKPKQEIYFRLKGDVISGVIKSIKLDKSKPEDSTIEVEHKGDSGITSSKSWKKETIYANQINVNDAFASWEIK